MSETKKPKVLVDVVGETCPIPLVEMRKALMKAESGQVVEIVGTHPASKEEIPMAVRSLGLKILESETDAETWRFWIEKE
jgi:TusA-related sulfurtransferase